MNKSLLLTLMGVVATMSTPTTFASDMTSIEVVTPTADKMMMPVEYVMPTNNISYSYDKDAVAKIINTSGSLLEVICNKDTILAALGFDASKKTITSVGFMQDGFDFSYDMRNCSMYGNQTNQNGYKKTTETQALQAAKSFMTTLFGTNASNLPPLGTPEIIAKDGNNGYPYPVAYDMMKATSPIASPANPKGLEIVTDSGSNEIIDVTYGNITIVFPYIIEGKSVYNQYGWSKMGVTLTVDGNGVTNINAPLLSFKAAVRKSTAITTTQAHSFIKAGGNNPYYPQDGRTETKRTLNLTAPESVYTYFNYSIDGSYSMASNKRYIGSAVRLGSSIPRYQGSLEMFDVVFSQYVIGNNNTPLFTMTQAESTIARPKANTKPKKKFIKKAKTM